MKMDKGMSRFTTDYMRSYQKSYEISKFKQNRKIHAPDGVTKYNKELGLEVEDRVSPFDKDIHAAGVKSPLMKKSLEFEAQFDSNKTVSK